MILSSNLWRKYKKLKLILYPLKMISLLENWQRLVLMSNKPGNQFNAYLKMHGALMIYPVGSSI